MIGNSYETVKYSAKALVGPAQHLIRVHSYRTPLSTEIPLRFPFLEGSTQTAKSCLQPQYSVVVVVGPNPPSSARSAHSLKLQ